MLTHTYDASHEHIHNDEPTWCLDHGYYIIIIIITINLLLIVIYIILYSGVFQPMSYFSCCRYLYYYIDYIFSNFAYLSCGVESKLVGTMSVRIKQYGILFSSMVSLVLYGLLR